MDNTNENPIQNTEELSPLAAAARKQLLQRLDAVRKSADAEIIPPTQAEGIISEETAETNADNDLPAKKEKKRKKAVNPGKGGERIKKAVVVISAVLTAFIILAVSAGAFLAFYKPDVGDTVDKGNKTNPVIDEKTDGEEKGDDDDGDETGTQGEDEPVVAGRKKGCYNFLVLGKDNVGLNTDVIMIVSVNLTDCEMSIIQIPRDTYIEIKGLSRKINNLYPTLHSYAYCAGAEDIDKTALEDMVATFEANMDIEIDYYALVTLSGVNDIINLIGGVPIDVPFDMVYDDPYQDLHINIKKGYQVLDGEKAQEFLRYRSGYVQGDIGRLDAQKLFMTALITQIKNNLNVNTILGMLNTLYTYVKTDIPLADLTYFAKSFFTLKDGSINFITFPGAGVSYNGSSYYIIKENDFAAVLDTYFNVTTTPITAETFDTYGIFVKEDSTEISEVYNSEPMRVNSYVRTVESIDKYGIGISVIE